MNPFSPTPRATARERLERTLQGLSRFPHRGSTTDQELEAASFLERELRLNGFDVLEQPFVSPTTYSWNVVGAAGLLALGAFFAWDGLWLGVPLAALGAWWFLAHFSLRGHFLDYFIPTAASRNVLTRFGQGTRHVVLMAHYDTARSAFLYNPSRIRSFRATFVLGAALAVLTPPLALGRLYLPLLQPLLLVIGIYFLVNAALFVLRERSEPHVNGANDNASGVAAALEVANRIWGKLGARVTLVFTGCEEVGARGAAEFLKTLEPQEYPNTLVLNLDNVGRGDLHYAVGEGMLDFVRSAPQALETARGVLEGRPDLEALPLEYRLAYFDTLPLARAGVPALTLIALEDGVIPHWHWPSDTLEHLDLGAVERAADFAEALCYGWVNRDAN